jgi:hypothetical protein
VNLVQCLGAFPLVASTGLAFRKEDVVALLGRVLGAMAVRTEHLVREVHESAADGNDRAWQLASNDTPGFVVAVLVAAACWVVAMLLLFAWIMRVALQCDDAAAHPQAVAAATTAAATSWQAKASWCGAARMRQSPCGPLQAFVQVVPHHALQWWAAVLTRVMLACRRCYAFSCCCRPRFCCCQCPPRCARLSSAGATPQH